MRPIFCGNFEFDARHSELERLFRKYGKVDRLDMKSGFAFVYMEDERDAEDAIRGLDQIEFGRKCRRLRVEWTKQERPNRRPESARKPLSNSKPSKTLFVINFDPYNTRSRDLERHFDRYGKIQNVRIRRNFAFIQFEEQEDATKALEATNLSKLMDRVISVEYANKDDNERRNGGESPDRRVRERSPRRREYGGGRRSPSPYRRREERGSPDYGRGRRSPSPYRGGGGGGRRASPDYGHHRHSPIERNSEDYHGRSPIERNSEDYHGRSRGSPSRGSPSPPPKDNNVKEAAKIGEVSCSISPKRQSSNTDDRDYHNHRSPSPEDSRVEMRTSPTNYGADSPEGGVSDQ